MNNVQVFIDDHKPVASVQPPHDATAFVLYYPEEDTVEINTRRALTPQQVNDFLPDENNYITESLVGNEIRTAIKYSRETLDGIHYAVQELRDRFRPHRTR